MDLKYQNGLKTQKEYIKSQKYPLNIQILPQHVKFYLKPEPRPNNIQNFIRIAKIYF